MCVFGRMAEILSVSFRGVDGGVDSRHSIAPRLSFLGGNELGRLIRAPESQ